MTITRFFMLILAFIAIQSLSAQDTYRPAIQQKIEGFILHTNNGEWDQAFDYMYPKLFTTVPKEELVGMMEEMETGITIESSNLQIDSVWTPVVEGSETFVRVDYSSDVNIKLVPDGMFDAPKSIIALEQQFKTTYGNDNVKWMADSKEFKVHAVKSMMAIKNGDADWKLLEINFDQPQLMVFLFSPSVREALVR